MQSCRQLTGSKSNAYNYNCNAGVLLVQITSATELAHYKFTYLYFQFAYDLLLSLFSTGWQMHILCAQEVKAC